MALTEIARKLKLTFSGFEAPGYHDEIERFRSIYGDAESIRIGDMDYIVINDVYKSDEYNDIPRNTSPLFFNSIKNNFAIIDAETSSILIDEVYSRITYMQRDCETDARWPTSEKIQKTMERLVGDSESIIQALPINEDNERSSLTRNRANIFQCQLIKDTGVSASPDVYSFMLKGGQIKEISDRALQMIQGAGNVSILDETNREELEARKSAIQGAVFDKYINSDVDIQSISVKSIFEIKMAFCKVHLLLESNPGKAAAKGGDSGKDKKEDPNSIRADKDQEKRSSIYRTTYLLASENNEFDALNANIHVCNCCGHDLVDARDEQQIQHLYTNIDAYDEEATNEAYENALKKSGKDSPLDHIVYAVGCEDCLTKCPECNSWHFDYQKLVGTRIYANPNLKLVPGREFIKGLRSFDGINYCSCREGIDWVYDERSGSSEEHDVIPVRDMVFINCANEKIADSEEYLEYLQKEFERQRPENAFKEREIARQCLNKYKNRLANRFETKVTGIMITSNAKCHECCICGGVYHGVLNNDRCPVCTEMFDEDKRMVTRVDGVVFMLRGSKKKKVINKYLVTKFGTLKKIPLKYVYNGISDMTDAPDAAAESSGT